MNKIENIIKIEEIKDRYIIKQIIYTDWNRKFYKIGDRIRLMITDNLTETDLEAFFRIQNENIEIDRKNGQTKEIENIEVNIDNIPIEGNNKIDIEKRTKETEINNKEIELQERKLKLFEKEIELQEKQIRIKQ